MLAKAGAFLRDDSGATAIEYALIGGLISIAVILGATAIGIGVNRVLFDASGSF